jgi:hypothetical protein
MPVEPSLFELVEKYAQELNDGKVSAEKPLKRTAGIVAFCQNFYLQFFQNVLNSPITSIGMPAKRVAARVAVERGDALSAETNALVSWFEELCDIYPDVLALGYGGSVAAFRRFHEEYIPTLLERIIEWASADGHDGVKDAAEAAQLSYQAALEPVP